MPEPRLMPSWQLEKVHGRFYRDITVIEEDVRVVNGHNGERKIITRNLVKKQEEFNDAVIVYFPQGHSMMIAADDHEQLIRLGFMRDPRLVDMESGEVAPESFTMTPKQIVEAAESRKRSTTMIGGLTELLEEAAHG